MVDVLFQLPEYGTNCAVIPAIIAGVAALGAAIVGSISNSNSNATNKEINADTNATNAANVAATNEANLQATRETNAANKMLQDAQNAWNLQQWNRENEYNSPASQVQRLKAAGINPAAVFGNGSISEASQLTSAPSHPAVAPQMQAAQAEAYYEQPGVGANLIANSLNGFAQARLANAQADKTGNDVSIANAQNVREAEKHIHLLEFLKKQSEGQGITNDLARETLAFSQATMQSKVAAAMNDVRLQEQAYKESTLRQQNLDIQNKLANIELQFSPLMKGAELQNLRGTLQQIGAQIKLINAQTNLTSEQKASEVEKRTSVILDNGLKADQVQIRNAIQNYVISDYINQSDINRRKSEHGEWSTKFFGRNQERNIQSVAPLW